MEASDHPQGTESGDSGPLRWPPGWTVEEVAEIASTNTDLVERTGSLPDRSVLRADHQTAGRGRLDRRWDAPAGANLLVSMLFHTVPSDPGELMRRVALAAVDATRSALAADDERVVSLKWPNDLLFDGRKLAGLLAQRAEDGSVVVGIGVNVGWAPHDAARVGNHTSPRRLLLSMLTAYDELPLDIDARYRRELGTLGQRVRVALPTGDLVGTAIDVERDGRLVVVDECAVSHRLSIGDVVHLRPA